MAPYFKKRYKSRLLNKAKVTEKRALQKLKTKKRNPERLRFFGFNK